MQFYQLTLHRCCNLHLPDVIVICFTCRFTVTSSSTATTNNTESMRESLDRSTTTDANEVRFCCSFVAQFLSFFCVVIIIPYCLECLRLLDFFLFFLNTPPDSCLCAVLSVLSFSLVMLLLGILFYSCWSFFRRLEDFCVSI